MGRLLRGMARTAVVAGTAQATRNVVNRHAADENAQAYSDAMEDVEGQQVVYAAPPQAAPASDPQEDNLAQLERLGALRDQGVLTEEEFATQKAKILAT